MLKVGNKRRRTKAQIKKEKQEEQMQQLQQQQAMAELNDLRKRIELAEYTANTNKVAGAIIDQMLNSGIAKQTAQNSIVVNAVDGNK